MSKVAIATAIAIGIFYQVDEYYFGGKFTDGAISLAQSLANSFGV
jgi:hypothetical protein